MAKDPICGMNVDEAKAAAKSEHAGQTYYFCSPHCKAEFDKNPAKYAMVQATDHGHDDKRGHGHGHGHGGHCC